MGPTTYALCQKPVIGLVMWITSLCAFPPLFSEAPLPLFQAGATLTKEFKVPVDKGYGFDLEFEFSSVAERLQDQIVGSTYNQYCSETVAYEDVPTSQRASLGRPIPIKVVVRRKPDRGIIFERTFHTRCLFAHAENKKWRGIGNVELVRGEYIAEVTNVESQVGLERVKTTISLVAGHGK